MDSTNTEGGLGITLPSNWRDYLTDDERRVMAHYSRFGSDCISKIGRMWQTPVEAAPLFKTKTAANDFMDKFVCETIPLRCYERAEKAVRS